MIVAKINAAISAIPDDSPSMLSRKLNEFISTTSHNTLIANSAAGIPRNAVPRTPTETSAAATPNCTANRGFQGRSFRSSIKPMIDSTVPPANTAHICPDRNSTPSKCGANCCGIQSLGKVPAWTSQATNCTAANGETTPSQIPIPPPNAVGALWTFRAAG